MANNQLTPDTSYESILKQASQQRSMIFKFSKAYPAYIILIITILMSFGAWYLVEQKVTTDRSIAFDKALTSVMRRLEFKYQNDYQVLQSMRSLYDNYVQVVRDVFELYGSIPARSYSSIFSIMYAPKVDNQDIENFIHYARSQGYYDYELHPEGQRYLYYPVEYIVPLDKNKHLSGYDFSTNRVIKEAIEKARDSNSVVSTQIFKIRKPDTTGFFLISPVYHREADVETIDERVESFEGVLLLEINSPVFFENALGSGIASDTSIVFECIDYDDQAKENVIYESSNSYLLKSNYEPYMKEDRDLNIADRIIKVRFYSIPNFGGTFQKILPIITFIISLLISIGFSAFILSVISSRARAVDLADRMTRSQRRILESSNDIIAVLDFNGVWKSMNPASEVIFGYKPNEMIGEHVDKFINKEDLDDFQAIFKSDQEEMTKRIVTHFTRNDLQGKWVSWSLTASTDDGLIYAIGRDITLEKLAEEEAALRAKQIRLAEQLSREVSEFKTYFMLKLSHQLRNSLTGMIGYLQLLTMKIYETEEEHDNFISMAEQSSEELFTFVSDIDDVASGSDKEDSVELSLIKIDKLSAEITQIMNEKYEEEGIIKLDILEGKDAAVVADKKILKNTLTEIFIALSEGLDESTIQINALENMYEGATEFQILSPANEKVSESIEIYNQNMSNHIEALKNDNKDILLRFALAASTMRMMNGSMKIDSLGEDGNVVMITLPLNKPTE